jgi:hypothetical protein
MQVALEGDFFLTLKNDFDNYAEKVDSVGYFNREYISTLSKPDPLKGRNDGDQGCRCGGE